MVWSIFVSLHHLSSLAGPKLALIGRGRSVSSRGGSREVCHCLQFKLGSLSAKKAYGQGPLVLAPFHDANFMPRASKQSDGRTRNRRKRGATLPPVVRSVRAAPFVAGQPSLELHSLWDPQFPWCRRHH